MFKTKVIILSLVIIATSFFFTGCASQYFEIPPGYIAKVLTPTGWDSRILESGQVDLGITDPQGRYSTLVILEATSITVKEQFLTKDASIDKQDHRVFTKDAVASTADVYLRLVLPEDVNSRNNVFVLATPATSKDSKRVRTITINDVYTKFASLDVRSSIRDVFSTYNDYEDAIANTEKISKEITAKVVQLFNINKVPLKLQNIGVSNIKPDEVIWDAKNKLKAATTIAESAKIMGEAAKNNPNYMEFYKWDSLKQIASTSSNLIIITDKDSFTPEELLAMMKK